MSLEKQNSDVYEIVFTTFSKCVCITHATMYPTISTEQKMSTIFIGSTLNNTIFFLLSLNREGHGKISVFAVKMALATLCGGKIMDKLRCKLPHPQPHLLLVSLVYLHPLSQSCHVPCLSLPSLVLWSCLKGSLLWPLNFTVKIFSHQVNLNEMNIPLYF